ncbi:dynein regulatory complex subunit 5-like [Glandiceps talaboti]
MTEPPLTEQNGTEQNGEKNEDDRGSIKSQSSQKGKKIPSPVPSTKDDAAADARNMRRIIAEDPDWSLATVPLLSELCVTHIVGEFQDHPKLDELLPKYKTKVLEKISTDIPLKVVAHLVSDEGYWKRRCKARWEICDVSKYGGSWKRMFFERHLETIVEHFVPETTDPAEVEELLPLAAPYIKKLNIRQLLPPVKEEQMRPLDDMSDAGSESGDNLPSIDHFEFSQIVEKLPHIEEFHVTYGVRDCGMNFEWNLFQFTNRDCLLLSKCIKKCNTLKVFKLHRSKVDDDKVRVLISHILDHPSLEELDLEHNMIGDKGARAIGKLLTNHSKLKKLNLSNNKIRASGAGAIGYALKKNSTLKYVNLRLNRLGDEGGQAVARALLQNSTLEEIDMGSNDMTEPTAAVLSQVVVQNTTLKKINLACNRLGPDGGKQLQEGMEENDTIVEMDLRLTEAGQESEYCINQILKKNQERERELRLEKEKKEKEEKNI